MRIVPHRALLAAFASALVSLPIVSGAQPPTGPTPPALGDRAQLDRVTALYDAGKLAQCVKEFDVLIGQEPKKIKDPEVLEKARIYYAACLIGTDQVERAKEQMRLAILANPRMRTPDTLVFPGPVIDHFLKVRESLWEEIKKAEAEDLEKKRREAAAAARRAAAEEQRVKALEERASQEVVVTHNERWIAALPFGAGQFQNREPVLGWIFLGSEALLAATALGAMVVELRLNATSDDQPPPDPNDLNTKLDAAHQVLVVSSWGFLAVASVGIAQAQIAFKPEFRDVVKKPLPPELRRPETNRGASLRPWVGPGFVGLGGHF